MKQVVARLTEDDMVLLLLRTAYRPLLIRRLSQGASYFRATADTADAAGAYHLTRALDFGKMQEVTNSLERHWLDLSLTGRVA